jgi:hypothetical protein
MTRTPEKVWRKSSRSGGTSTSSCVEVAFTTEEVGVRDSKNTEGPQLAFPSTTWKAFATSMTR